MRVRTFHFSAAGTGQGSFVVDADGTLVGVAADTGFIVSSDPSLTAPVFVAAAADFQSDQLIILANGTDFNSLYPLNFPLAVGERIFVSVDNTPANLQLYIE